MKKHTKTRRQSRLSLPWRAAAASGEQYRHRKLTALALLLTGTAFLVGYLQVARQPTALCFDEDLTDIPDAVFAQADMEVSTDPNLKRVCLTFDDGPSKNTEEVLRILAEQQVPATFFVIAAENNQNYLPLVQQEVEQGNQVALHSCTHEYREIYQSPEAYWADIDNLKEQLSAYIDVSSVDCLRFPGGSTNTVSHKYGGSGIMKTLKAQTEEKGWHWIDWNVCAEDATASHPDAAQILRNIRRDADGQDTCVVLLHDTKATGQTVKALPDIIAYFREQGYNFCTVAQMDALQCETK